MALDAPAALKAWRPPSVVTAQVQAPNLFACSPSKVCCCKAAGSPCSCLNSCNPLFPNPGSSC